MAQDEAPAVVGLHLEIAVPRIEPAIEDLEHCKAPLAERKGARLLLAAVACVALDADRQCARIHGMI